jgi:hypothetical protein
MTDQDARPNAAAAGTFHLGGGLLVNRMGFGAMRLTGRGILGEPEDSEDAELCLVSATSIVPPRRVTTGDTTEDYLGRHAREKADVLDKGHCGWQPIVPATVSRISLLAWDVPAYQISRRKEEV